MNINSKINNYLDERLVYFIMLAQLDGETYDDIIASQKEGMSNILEKIFAFQVRNKDCLPEFTCHNIINFINRPGVRFKDGNINKENNEIINKIIENANSSKFIKNDFVISESKKFFKFGKKTFVKECKADDFCELEQLVHIFVVDMLFASDEEYSERYLKGGEGTGNESVLFVINYLINDFPIIFRDQRFYDRCSGILGCNVSLCMDEETQIEDLDENMLFAKILIHRYKKSFYQKNHLLLENLSKNKI